MLKYDPHIDGITQGLLSMFMRCREETKNFLEGLEAIRSSGPLQFGSIAHDVLERVYRANKKFPNEAKVLQILEESHKAFINEEGGRLSGEGAENLETNMSMLQAVLPEYFKFHKKDFSDMSWVELEEKFCVPSPVRGVNLIGRIDGAFKPNTKELWLFESKTKGRIEEDNLSDSLTFDFQNNIYQYALRHKYGKQPDGVLYNIIRRPGNKLKKDEPLTAFSTRIREGIQQDPSYYFMRYEISIPKTELGRFEYELTSIVKEFVAWWKGEIATYRNTSACVQRYGACRFLPKCANGETGLYRTRAAIFPELQGE